MEEKAQFKALFNWYHFYAYFLFILKIEMFPPFCVFSFWEVCTVIICIIITITILSKQLFCILFLFENGQVTGNGRKS